ncbi:putative cytosol aminopeptidase [Calocera viscosa TUFC12733]|uniref:Putative cytosol aminopeptidase n=1 Tax=Calocera viscosa (strain TUFC12733) TaxID=1330018 RepID=A0A167GZX0_CALVF|nr:putative cytosol aminopeptidase [Calocera viscosa TUFC12733]
MSLPPALVIPLLQGSALAPSPLSEQAFKAFAASKPKYKQNETRIFYNLDGKGTTVAAVSVGKGESPKQEAVRSAVAKGTRALKDAGEDKVGIVVGQAYAHAAAVGAYLSVFNFDALKTEKEALQHVEIVPLIDGKASSASSLDWETGKTYAYAQNLARELMELPANIMTPTAFCARLQKEFAGVPNADVTVHDEAWAEKKGMRTFLSVTHGTEEPAKFLEVHYNGGAKGAQPLAFVGKGITFDSGGISLKPGAGMKSMRADMGGAATLMSAALAIAKLKLPVNLIAVAPLTENLPSGKATKPGDIIYAMNGKTVEVDNTDAEGRLVLSDALYYVTSEYKPHTVIDAATLTGAIQIALGEAFAGVFTNSDSLWSELQVGGAEEHDRFWRMPLDDDYMHQIDQSNADLQNTGGRPAGSCTAAIFLKAFVDGVEAEEGSEPRTRWAHVDIAGVMETSRPGPYQNKGMTGRATRSFIEFARRLAADRK